MPRRFYKRHWNKANGTIFSRRRFFEKCLIKYLGSTLLAFLLVQRAMGFLAGHATIFHELAWLTPFEIDIIIAAFAPTGSTALRFVGCAHDGSLLIVHCSLVKLEGSLGWVFGFGFGIWETA
mmetsp:Transcript_490/g.980  ORF Transcript_490/g.980 Transcript_490/m.980 type:complete len:122 (+) Transcript_490:775-1140(+)